MNVPKWLRPYKNEQYIIRRTIRNRTFFSYIWNKYIHARKIRKTETTISAPVTNPELTVHMLLCHSDVTMALWSLLSFYRVSNIVGQLVIHSDGTLTNSDCALMKKLLPEVIILDKTEADVLVKESDLSPEIKDFRLSQNNVYLKKLIDTCLVTDSEYHLIIDSDLVWFSNPTEIESVVLQKKKVSRMLDKTYASKVYLKEGKMLSYDKARYNGGIILFHRDVMHIDRLFTFFDMLDMSKPQRFIGQSGHAYCLDNLEGLPMDRYLGSRASLVPGMVMKHYTQVKREYFFTEGIHQIDKVV